MGVKGDVGGVNRGEDNGVLRMKESGGVIGRIGVVKLKTSLRLLQD